MPRGFSKEAEIEIEKRRKVVTANLAAGLSYRDIAAYLGVSISTISNDVKVVIKRLRTAQETDYVEYSRSKCAELTQLSTQFGGKYCKAIYPRFDNSYSYKTNGQSFQASGVRTKRGEATLISRNWKILNWLNRNAGNR